MNRLMREAVAQHADSCDWPRCKRYIEPGQRIVKHADHGWIHEEHFLPKKSAPRPRREVFI